MSHLSLSSSGSREAGFSLVEILLVILIILMLAGALIVYVLPQQEGAQISTTKLKLQNLSAALEIYKLNMGAYPRPEHGGLKALLEQPKLENAKQRDKWKGPYVDRSATFDDAWGNDLKYKLSDPNRQTSKSAPLFLLYSLGPDGKENTQDDIHLVERKSRGLGDELNPGDGLGGATGALDGIGGGTSTLPASGSGTGGTVPTPTPPGS